MWTIVSALALPALLSSCAGAPPATPTTARSAAAAHSSGASPIPGQLNVDRLEPPHQQLLDATLKQLEPMITTKKQDGTANLISWEQLYLPAAPEQRALMDSIRALLSTAFTMS